VSARRAGDAAAALRGALDTPPAGPAPRPLRPAPAVATSKLTIRIDPDTALAFDRLLLALRGRLGRRASKQEVLEALIWLAGDDQALFDLLTAELVRRHDGMTA
jgi:hypothetical protein